VCDATGDAIKTIAGPIKSCIFFFFTNFKKKINHTMKAAYLKLLPILCCCISLQLQAQETIKYTRQEAMIPMRDGVKLYTVIYTPSNTAAPVPILIQRTPYGSADFGSPDKSNYLKDMAAEGYIFVEQDIRGRYKSEGQFVMNRPITDKAGEIDESTDTYDAIEWLLKNMPTTMER
jgi:uncharacterized protein